MSEIVLFEDLGESPATTGTIDVVADVSALPHAEPFTMRPRTAYPVHPQRRSAPILATQHVAFGAVRVEQPRHELSPWEVVGVTLACTFAVLAVALLGFLTVVGA